MERDVWAEIDLAAVRHNVRQIKTLIKNGAEFCAVVKADGYGHGAAAVAKAALEAGADRLAVAMVKEVRELREAGITVPVLVLGCTPPEIAGAAVAADATLTVASLDGARALSAAAAAAGRKVKVHLKIDTGMSRIGVKPENAGDLAAAVTDLPGLELEGVFSHFASADSREKEYANKQYAGFQQALARIEARGIKVKIRHIANSAATLDMPHTHLDMVRPGIILYGLWPSDEVSKKIELKPAMKLKARVSYVKEVNENVSIGYGRSFFTRCKSVIATLPIGYADGYSRLLAGKAEVVVKGRRAPVVGRVCMDQCMIDVTGIDGVRTGDEVLMFGGDALSADEIARHLGTINYEVVCMVGKRVPRVYV